MNFKIRAIKTEHSIKDLAIIDAFKSKNEMYVSLKEFTSLFEFVKNERSKFVNIS